MKTKIFLSLALLVPGLLFLPACDWFGGDQKKAPAQEHKSGSTPVSAAVAKEVVVTIDGKPAVTVEDFERGWKAVVQSQPMFEQMMPFMPADQQRMVYQQIAENMAGRIIIRDYVDQQGWSAKPEYKETLQQAHEDLDYDMASREFQNRILQNISVDDAQARREYEQNKSTNQQFQRPPFLLAPEGVKTLGVKAKDEAQAKAIMAAAQKSGDLKKAASEHKQSVQDLGSLNAQSTNADRMVVIKALSMQSFPSVDMVQGSDGYWVLQGVSKEEAKFVPFDQVKDQVKEVVTADRFQKKYFEEFNKLKEKRNLSVNQEFLDSKVPQAEQPEEEQQAPEAVNNNDK